MSKDITDELIIREETSGYSFENSKGDMKEDIKELKRLFYSNRLTQYGKRKLIGYYEQRIKELEEFKKQVTEIENTNFIKYKNYIPVSLVEKKIEEYKNNMKLYENETHNIFNENNIRQEVITVLQELLEKRK